MEIAELVPALDELEGAVTAVSDALNRYRDGDVTVAEAEAQMESAAERYDRASAEAARIIIGQLAAESDGTLVFDDDAVSKLAVAITIDAKVAEQAALLLEMEPQYLDQGRVRGLGQAARDDLGPDVRAECGPLIADLGRAADAGGQPQPGSPCPGAPGLTITRYVEQILDHASDDMVCTLSKLMSWEQQTLALIRRIGDAAGPWLQDVLPRLGPGWSALRHLLARAWRQVIHKVACLVGRHGSKLLEELGADPFDLLDRAVRQGRMAVLAGLLDTAAVIRETDALLGPAGPQKAAAALRRCDTVLRHYDKRRRAVPMLNKALPACSLVSLSGFPLKTVAGVTLLLYSLWMAHDHLDSPRLESLRLPRNPGLRRAVEEALRD